MTDAENIATSISLHYAALAADAVNPAPDYSIDGQSVSRAAWRANELKVIRDLYEMGQFDTPYEVRSYVL